MSETKSSILMDSKINKTLYFSELNTWNLNLPEDLKSNAKSEASSSQNPESLHLFTEGH